jgi:hypothetical protein
MSDLEKVAKKWHAARNRERSLARELHDAIRAAVDGGMTEVVAAEIAGVDRGTVRRAVGKPRQTP